MSNIPTSRYGKYNIYYYPGNRIEIRDGQFKIVIHKTNTYRGSYSNENTVVTDSVLAFSSNSTVLLNLHDYIELGGLIGKCIEKLNSEGGDQIVDTGIPLDMNKTKVKSQASRIKQEVTVKYIKPSQLKIGNVYEKVNGTKMIYLGRGRVYKYTPNNREYAGEDWRVHHAIRIDNLSDISNIETSIEQPSPFVTNFKIKSPGVYVEAQKTPYKFIKDLGNGLPELTNFIATHSINGLSLVIVKAITQEVIRLY